MKRVLTQVVSLLTIVGTAVCCLPGSETQSSSERIALQARRVADLSLKAEEVAIPPFLNPIDDATVLVGAISHSTGPTTFGTGFIVENRDRVYVVTCRHIILEASSTSLFAIPKPQKTKSPPGGYTVLTLGKPIYHPKDRATGTYDIAVLEIVNAKKQLRALGIAPIKLGPSGAEKPNEGLELVAAGYPVDYAKQELSLGRSERLWALRVSGTVRHVPHEALTQSGFRGILREGYFAQTTERPLGKGASGGAVYVVDERDAVRVVGVLLGSADVQIKEDGRMVGVTGFFFASSLRIIETLPDSRLLRSRGRRDPSS